MVTAELAVAILAVVPVAASMIMLAGLAAVQVEVVEAARQGARSMARGDPESAVRADVVRIRPGASVATSIEGSLVTVTVSEPVGGWSLVPRFSLSASATAALEEGLDGAS
jgi:hypothetical protein